MNRLTVVVAAGSTLIAALIALAYIEADRENRDLRAALAQADTEYLKDTRSSGSCAETNGATRSTALRVAPPTRHEPWGAA